MRPLANFTYFLFPTFCPSHNCNCWCGESSHLGKQFIVTTFKTNVRNVPYSSDFYVSTNIILVSILKWMSWTQSAESWFPYSFNCLSSLTCGICRRHSGDFQSKEGAGTKWRLLTSFSRCWNYLIYCFGPQAILTDSAKLCSSWTWSSCVWHTDITGIGIALSLEHWTILNNVTGLCSI